MLTTIETETLRAILSREAAPTSTGELAAGDVVQIRPTADRTFGGMLALVQQATPHQVRAILLRPHRGGCREAWLRLSPPEVARIGAAAVQHPAFGRRCEWRTPGCRYAP
jgi:hypothetical protein